MNDAEKGYRVLPAGSEVYAGLTPASLLLAGVRYGDAPPAVNLLLQEWSAGGVFAGTATALETARRIAVATGRTLRVVTVRGVDEPVAAEQVRSVLAASPGPVPPVSAVFVAMLEHTVCSRQDLWLPTYWSTAHAADVACRLGVIEPQRVVYLVQDYEPSFHPWSVQHAVTRQTYHAGFHHVVNSRSLADYLTARERVPVDPQLVLGPHLDLDRLAAVAAARRPAPGVRVFFYARPTKPRNLYELGLAALRATAARLAGSDLEWEVVSAGGRHEDQDLGHGRRLTGLGVLSWDAYFGLLPSVDVGLTLMHSPHPSHPPLELAVSGALAVTNDLDGVRTGFHPRVVAADADPDALADALVAAIRQAAEHGPGGFDPAPLTALGHSMDEVLTHLLPLLPQT